MAAQDRGQKPRGPGEEVPMSSDVPTLGFFDRFATKVAHFVSRAPFFAFCVLLVVVWAPSFFVIGNVDTWQLVINTLTTIVTFLLVALLQNTQSRADRALQEKLNAIADALTDVIETVGQDRAERARDVAELRHAVGLEDCEGSKT